MIFDSNEKVNIILNSNTSPAFNLAAEEVFFKRRTGCFIMLWQNEKSIIIGRNQNAHAEIDTGFAAANGIEVIRRLTGGGAVFHDIGNLNFTFIGNGGKKADFLTFLTPVADYLRSLGLNAEFSGRNDILVDGKKVSGCAQASSQNRQLVHGTLLFNADMSLLASALKPNPLKLQSKGIASVKSRVANIYDLLDKKMTVEQFRDGLFRYLCAITGCDEYNISSANKAEIAALAAEKYSQHSWNFGAAPAYSLERTARVGNSLVTVCFNIEGGKIKDIKIFGDFFGDYDIADLEKKLTGIAHSAEEAENALCGVPLEKYIGTADKKAFAALFN